MSAMIDRVELREIEGYIYRRTVLFGPQQAPSALARPIARFVLRIRPSTRKRLAGALRVMRDRAYMEPLDRWDSHFKSRLTGEIDRLGDIPLGSVDDRSLDAHADAVLRLSLEGSRLHEQVRAAAWITVGRFISNCGTSLSYDAERCLALINTAGEEPNQVMQTARQALPETARTAFDEQLATAGRAAAARSDSYFLAIERPLTLGRAVLMEIGRRMCERHQLNATEDAEFLSIDEARAALRDGARRQETVGARRSAWRQESGRQPTETFGERPGGPPSQLYPRDVREMTVALLLGIRVLESEPSRSGGE